MLTIKEYFITFVILLFLPLKVASIIISGLGIFKFPPITLIMYIFTFLSFCYWLVLVSPNKVYSKLFIAPIAIKFTYLIFVATYITVFFISGEGDLSYVSPYLGFLFSFFSYLVLGVFLYFLYLNGSFNSIVLVWLCSIFPIIMIGSITDFTINYRLLFGEFGYDYLLVGDIIVLLSFILLLKLPPSKNYNLYFSFFFIITLFVLIKNGSRTSFYAFIIAYSISTVIVKKFKGIAYFSMCLVCMLLLFFAFKVELSVLTESRIFMLFDFGSSSSLGARQQLHNFGVERINNNLFLGDMLGQIRTPLAVSPFGSYMHSIFSHYSQFGIVPFVLYISSWGALFLVYIQNSSNYNSMERLSILAILLYSSISLILSRSFVHTIFELFWMFSFLVLLNKNSVVHNDKGNLYD